MCVCVCVCVLRKKLYKKYCMTVLTLTIVNREKNALLMTRGKTSFYTHTYVYARLCNYIVHRKGLLH